MTVREIQDEIIRLKKENDICKEIKQENDSSVPSEQPSENQSESSSQTSSNESSTSESPNMEARPRSASFAFPLLVSMILSGLIS